ncbi:hypothetical protein BCR33DRAFT_698067 [Rhizoclosmatium globosum]|uniref:Ribosomal RNA-processing protein 8 n=1 Tax=Rhizoclosmatium globosum TaxID=329046 RepID=A0A1Y2CAH5_9FUNG|nr:hypothetical protein BCR33DRAFT_698067 [Rhizoclosmatium globosum]|eukprot:ORY43335.1 hypothetical protein BCR33DRAFT_698067 [Rhizoclosmatium globosum]
MDTATQKQATKGNKRPNDQSTSTNEKKKQKNEPKQTAPTTQQKSTSASAPAKSAAAKIADDKKAKLLQALSRSKHISESSSKPVSKPVAQPASSSVVKKPHQLSKPTPKPPQSVKPISTTPQNAKLTDLQAKMKKTLSGGRFRMINEQLYTTTSDIAVELFKEAPETFDIYHEGFRAQVELWPSNPVDHFIQTLSAAKIPKTKPLVIADMGCGEAALARSLLSQNTHEKQKFTVHSFDLASPNEFVVACDIRSVPLEDGVCDVVVFSLSLMGTNFIEFLEEAWRILRDGGQLRIAEVVSRFPDIDKFVEALTAIGFKLTKKDASNKMFILFDFLKKGKKAVEGDDESQPLLTPCLYRKR